MAPQNQIFKIANVLYNVPILNGEMDIINIEINVRKEEIGDLNNHVRNANASLLILQNQLLVLYIQSQGSFPPSS